MNSTKLDIGIVYYKNSFDVAELNAIETELAKRGLKLISHERSPYVNASIDFFVPYLELLLSPDMMALGQNLLTSLGSDGIKWLLKYIYNKFHKKPVFKIKDGNITEETANIHFVVGNNRLVLPVDTDMEKFEYVVDRFISAAASSAPTEITYIFLSEKDDTILSKTENEIIQEEYAKYQNKEKREE